MIHVFVVPQRGAWQFFGLMGSFTFYSCICCTAARRLAIPSPRFSGYQVEICKGPLSFMVYGSKLKFECFLAISSLRVSRRRFQMFSKVRLQSFDVVHIVAKMFSGGNPHRSDDSDLNGTFSSVCICVCGYV